ncbi:MAG TPA: hypothetical protein VFK50_04115 [Sphingomicrobium sp.]|nr:hypothetical protein [Sphingomicrobium sp.]
MFKQTAAAFALAIAVINPAIAQPSPPQAASARPNPYAPFDWLIGDWYAKGGPGMLREQISYGPNRSYIRFSVYTAPSETAPQHLHFEGIAVWNGKTGVLDYLFAVEPGSGAQENGIFRAEPDGSIIREVELIDAQGKSGTFRQTFRRTGGDSAITSVMRKTETGWEPTFPGGENIELRRRTL